MPGAYFNPETIMSNPRMSLSRTPFNPEIMVIKRASFPKGKGRVPPHLETYKIAPGTCPKGTKGTVVYGGKKVPKCAAIIAEKKRKR